MRRRLVAMVVAGSVAALLAFALPLAVTAKLLVESRLYAEAEVRSRVVAAVLDEAGTLTAAADALGRVGAADGRVPVAIVFGDGRVIGGPLDDVRRDRARAAVTHEQREARLRVDDDVLVVTRFGAGDGPTSGVVVSLVPGQLVTRDLDGWWWSIGALAVGLFAVFVFLADRMGRSIVAPVVALVDASDALRRGRLQARVVPEGPPELRRLGVGFNLLADRILELVRLERDRVADLSHRLRTPITALHLEVDAVADGEQRSRLVARVARLEHELDTVLAEARRVADPSVAIADLAAVARERAAFWEPLFDDQGRRLALDVMIGTAVVGLAPIEVASLVDELLGNAVTHTPPGTSVGLVVGAGPGTARLEVHDAGPGFPDGFTVARGRSGNGSSGLGLDIIRRTADAAGGSLVVGRGRWGGAAVTLTLPRLDAERSGPEPAGGVERAQLDG